jgi:hypothetical protein
MEFKVGDKVKYDSGDWWFYGTVGAVIENSINPCYRINVERMEKKNCKFSITQFEFELSFDKDVEGVKENLKWEKSELDYLKQIQELTKKLEEPKVIQPVAPKVVKQDAPAVIPPVVPKESKPKVEKPPRRTKSGAWDRNLEMYLQGERSNAIYTWMAQNRRLFKNDKLAKEKVDKLTKVNFPFVSSKKRGRAPKPAESIEQPKQKEIKPEAPEKQKRTKSSAWEKNLELYKKGDKSNVVYAWIARNRKMNNINKLTDDQLEKLLAIKFPFEAPPRKKQPDSWDKQLQLWKNGNRNPSLQLWREKSVKRFVEGKLSQDRIGKLKEIGILK